MRYIKVIGLALLLVGGLVVIAVAHAAPVSSILAAAKIAAQKYPHADAVFLQSEKSLRLDGDGTVTDVIHRQTLVRTKAGIKEYGGLFVLVTYSQGVQTASFDYVRIIYPTGKVVTVPPADIQRAPLYKFKLGYKAVLNAAGSTIVPAAAHPIMVAYVSLPIDQLGTVIDWQATVTGIPLQSELPHEIYGIDRMGVDLPTLNWRFVVSVPRAKTLFWRNVNTDITPSVSTNAESVQYTFAATDIPAIDTSEPHMPSGDALAPQVVVSTIDSWERIADAYGRVFFASAVATDAIKKKASALTADCTTRQDKIDAIYKFVMQKISYFMTGSLFPVSAATTFAQGKGDCQDQSALLVAMLRAVGIDAYPVLLNAEPGMDVDFNLPPTFVAFDHVIVAVAQGATWRFLDPSAGPFWTLDEIPAQDRDRHGLLIIGDEHTPGIVVHTDTSAPADSSSSTVAQFTLSPDWTLTGQATTTLTGDIAAGWRAQTNAGEIRASYLDDLNAQLHPRTRLQAHMLSVSTSDPLSAHDPFKVTTKFQVTGLAEFAARKRIILLLDPLPFVSAYADYYSPQPPSGSRKYPYLITPERMDTRIFITLPPGGHLDLFPNISVTTDVGSFSVQYYYLPGTNERTIVVERHLEFDVARIPVRNMDALQAIVTQLQNWFLQI